MKFRPRKELSAVPFQLTAMIDVILVLLMFFIISYRVDQRERIMDLKLPVAEQGKQKERVKRETIVSVNAAGEISVEGKVYSREELTAKLKALVKFSPTQVVLLRGDAKCDYQMIMGVIDACYQAGVSNVSFSTNPVKK